MIRCCSFLLFLASAAGADLRTLVASGNLADLRWPDFSDCRAEVRSFYEANGYAPAWSHAGVATPQALALLDVLRGAESKGLDAEDYDGSRWAARKIDERFDVALTVSAIRYLSDLHAGRLNPGLYCPGFDIAEKRCQAADLLRKLVTAADVRGPLDALEPSFAGYQRTRKALEKYRAAAREDDGELLPATKKPVEPGTEYAGVARLARLLRRLGDLPADAPVPLKYEGPLVEAVKRFQARHGLDPDGRLGKGTIAALNTPLAQRVRQLELTLERWRWVPREYSRPPLVVNLPEFRLRAFNAVNETELEMKLVVGRAYGHQTPVFAAEMNEVIFRPYWNVPRSITRQELLPKIEKDRDYAMHNGYEAVTAREQVIARGTIDDDTLAKLRSGALALRQVPGPKNSLGLVKFLFPNEYDVYLHDTPATTLFARSRRDFSHGCMRVEKPVALAEWVLRAQNGWTPEKIEEAMHGESPLPVRLARPIPVLVVYATAVALDSGEVRFFDDLYGQDAQIEALLAQGFPRPRWTPTTSVPGRHPHE